MVEVPMQYAGRLQLAQLLELEPQGPRREIEAPGHLHEEGKRRTLEGNGEAASQRREIDAMAVEARHHPDAREPAFGGFGLQVHRQSLRRSETKVGDDLHQARPASPSSGSKIHSI